MIKRYHASYEDIEERADGLYVYYADHLEELDHALKGAAGRIMRLTSEIARRDIVDWKFAEEMADAKMEIIRLTAEVKRLRNALETIGDEGDLWTKGIVEEALKGE